MHAWVARVRYKMSAWQKTPWLWGFSRRSPAVRYKMTSQRRSTKWYYEGGKFWDLCSRKNTIHELPLIMNGKPTIRPGRPERIERP